MATDLKNSGIAYTIIPSDVNRIDYIEQCFDNNKISIMGENSEVYHDVSISDEDLQNILFPENNSVLGSPVVWIRLEGSNIPIVLKVLKGNDEISDLRKERQKKVISKSSDGNTICEVEVNSESGEINILIDSSNKETNFEVNVKSKEGANLKFNVDGSITVNASQNVVLNALGSLLLKSFEEGGESSDITVEKDNINLNSGKVSLGNGAQSAALGDNLVSFLENLVNALVAMTVTTAAGPVPPVNISQFQQLQQELANDTIKSKVTFID